jgi:serine/threonine protein kinase
MINSLFPRYKNEKVPDLDDFNLEKKLGEGNYGYVWKYVHKTTGLAYAVKKIKIPKIKREIIMIQKEIEILYKIDN